MTPEQLTAVASTAKLVQADSEGLSRRFYDRLFELAPGTRELFPADLTESRMHFVDELVFFANEANHLPAFLAHAHELGVRSRQHGITCAEYVLFEQAMVEALAETLGDGWDEDLEAAWRRLYCLVSEAMLEGASSELFSGG